MVDWWIISLFALSMIMGLGATLGVAVFSALKKHYTLTFLSIVFVVSLVVFGAMSMRLGFFDGQKTGFEQGYKQGQIDALSGKTKYKLIEEKVWVTVETVTQPTEKE